MTEHIERRVLAVLSADVVAYTGSMETADEATHARLMEPLSTVIRPQIAAYGGRIVEHTGDGFLAAFDDILTRPGMPFGYRKISQGQRANRTHPRSWCGWASISPTLLLKPTTSLVRE